MAILSLDFETASLADLRRVGAHAYARHPSTMVLCLAWAFDNEPVAVWRPGQPFPQRLLDHVAAGGIVRGWNVVFEWLIWNSVMLWSGTTPWLTLLPTQLQDTMAAAAYWGLPLGLDQAAQAAHVGVVKDAEGHSLMLRMCRPRAIDAFGIAHWWHLEDPAKYARLCLYCGRDVEAERAVGNSLPPLPDAERRYWAMDLEMNARGVPVDTDLVQQLQVLAVETSRRANADLDALTGGAVRTVTNTKALLGWLQQHRYPFDNLQKGTVALRLDMDECFGEERAALELRGDNAKTSAAKLQTMLRTVEVHHGVQVVRGMLQYYGALRTGRWAGRLIQLQNLPRGTIKGIDKLVSLIARGLVLDDLEPFGSGLDIVSSALRSCITARPGHTLFVADFSQIEARVLAWLARQQDMLRVFKRGDDPYLYAAAQQRSDNRQFGKVLVLALGFGMGWAKFQRVALGYGIKLDEGEAARAVRIWRQANDHIVKFWRACDRAIAAAWAGRFIGRVVTVGKLKFAVWHGHLLVGLPSGRSLIYREVDVFHDPDRPPGEDFVTITFAGLNQYTRKWERIRTWGAKIGENVTQALARDIMAEAAAEAVFTHALPLCLMVHDELIGEAAGDGTVALARLLTLMRTPPAWCPDLPVEAVGWTGARYKKG